MRRLRSVPLLALLFLAGCRPSGSLYRTDASTMNNLRSHVQFLADDRLEGRRTGTAGEVKAMEYIRDRFQEAGIGPKGKDGFIE